MTEALFGMFTEGAPRLPMPVHAHTDPCTFCATRDGAGARDAGIKATARRDLEWWTRAEAWVDNCTDHGTTFTADDLIEAIGLPDGCSNAVGAFLSTQRRFGLIEPVGFTEATRPSSHARVLRVWRVIA